MKYSGNVANGTRNRLKHSGDVLDYHKFLSVFFFKSSLGRGLYSLSAFPRQDTV